jgi:hypothetical protein
VIDLLTNATEFDVINTQVGDGIEVGIATLRPDAGSEQRLIYIEPVLSFRVLGLTRLQTLDLVRSLLAAVVQLED